MAEVLLLKMIYFVFVILMKVEMKIYVVASCMFSVMCLQVKQIMEEAVTRKFVHEDSSHIIALCGKNCSCIEQLGCQHNIMNPYLPDRFCMLFNPCLGQ